MPLARLVAFDELVEVLATDRLLLPRDGHIGTETVDPRSIGPGLGQERNLAKGRRAPGGT